MSENEVFSFGAGDTVLRLLCVVPVLRPALSLGGIHLFFPESSILAMCWGFIRLVFISQRFSLLTLQVSTLPMTSYLLQKSWHDRSSGAPQVSLILSLFLVVLSAQRCAHWKEMHDFSRLLWAIEVCFLGFRGKYRRPSFSIGGCDGFIFHAEMKASLQQDRPKEVEQVEVI